jgi:late competence protein required for DNA uptake (superfamily II DNA/RNA helicase)
MKKTVKILIIITSIAIINNCTVTVLESEEKIVKTYVKELDKTITSKIHYFKDGKCDYNLTCFPDTTILDRERIMYKVSGGKIVMKNHKYIITPNCNADSLMLRTYYFLDSSEILLEEINLREVRGY